MSVVCGLIADAPHTSAKRWRQLILGLRVHLIDLAIRKPVVDTTGSGAGFGAPGERLLQLLVIAEPNGETRPRTI